MSAARTLPADGQPVELTGVLSHVTRHTAARTGTHWATVELDTGNGVIEVTVFPLVHERVADLIVAGTPVRITGRVDERDGLAGVIARNVERAA